MLDTEQYARTLSYRWVDLLIGLETEYRGAVFGSKPFGLFGVHFMTFSSDKLPFPINEPQNKVHQFSRSKHSTVRTVACKWTHPFSALRSASGGSFNVFEPLVYIIWIFLFFGVPASKSIVHFAVLRLGSCLHPEVERSLSLHLRCSPP